MALNVGARHPGYRAEVGITELALVIQYAKRPKGPRAMAAELVNLSWPTDQALEFADIVARTCEIVFTRRKPRG